MAITRVGGFCGVLLIVIGAPGVLRGQPAVEPMAGVPNQIPYSGVLELDGEGVSDAGLTMVFRLWDDPAAGEAGEELWNETVDVPIAGGKFAVSLGAINPIPEAVLRHSELYLSIAVDGLALAGRQQLQSAPFAQRAGDGVPVGSIIAFAGSTPPDGWLLCDGTALHAEDYPDLFAAIGEAWGDGTQRCADTGCDFNLPDLRGQFLRGVDGGAGEDPDADTRVAGAEGGAAGDNVGSLQGHATAAPVTAGFTADAAGNHHHTFAEYSSSGGSAGPHWEGLNLVRNTNTSTAGEHSHSVSGGDVETRPENAYVHYIVRY